MSFNYFEALSHVATYSKFRPCPPNSLVEKILNFLKEKSTSSSIAAVDIGCGAGQSTAILAPYFEKAIGLDPSPDIIKEATAKNQCSNVTYRVSKAEEIVLEDASVDVVTTAQAIHWFDKPKFYSEVSRVLKPNGVLAVYGYNLPELSSSNEPDKISYIVRKYYNEVLGEFVYPESRQVYIENYKDPIFNNVPFAEAGLMQRFEGFVTESDATVNDIKGYVSSWSGFQRYVRTVGEEAGKELLDKFEKDFEVEFGKIGEASINVQYRYFLLLGRKVA